MLLNHIGLILGPHQEPVLEIRMFLVDRLESIAGNVTRHSRASKGDQ